MEIKVRYRGIYIDIVGIDSDVRRIFRRKVGVLCKDWF